MKPSQRGIEVRPLWEEYVVCKTHRGEPNVGFIYALLDPLTRDVRYIGQTKQDTRRRYVKHLSDSLRLDNHVNRWVKKLLISGKKPIIYTIEECWTWELDEKEINYIKTYRESGCDLTNTSNGGQSVKIFSEETKRKISESLKGKIQSFESRKKRSESSKKTWSDPLLKEEKRRLAKYYNSIGVFGNKGVPSPKKGKPFVGDKNKLSASLKEHYKHNEPVNKFMPQNIGDIIGEYNDRTVKIIDIAKKYGIHRTTLTTLMKRNNIPLRNGNQKLLS